MVSKYKFSLSIIQQDRIIPGLAVLIGSGAGSVAFDFGSGAGPLATRGVTLISKDEVRCCFKHSVKTG